MEKNCTKCLKALPSDSTFCPACGTSVISTTSPTNDAVPTNWTHKPAIVVPLAVTASILVIALVGALVSNSSNGSSNNATKSNSSASSDGSSESGYTAPDGPTTEVNGVTPDSNAGDFVTGYNRNMMRLNGLDAFDSNGNSLTLGEFAKMYLDFLNSRLSGGSATSEQIAISLEPGNSIYQALHQFFNDEAAIAVVGEDLKKDAGAV